MLRRPWLALVAAVCCVARPTPAGFGAGTSVSAPAGLPLGPDGDLYAALDPRFAPARADSVKRFDGATGQFLGTFATAGVDVPQSLLFAPDGSLFVANQE